LDILRTFGVEPAMGLDFEARMRLRKPLLALSRREIAGLAPDVFRLSRSGDSVATAILQAAAKDLAGLAASVARPGACVLGAGGVLSAGAPFTDWCAAALKSARPDAALIFRPDFDLLKAACIMALVRAGTSLTKDVLRNLGLQGVSS
jgi:N-acetylglucosamine kinase-like BadF-type ATPase